MATGTNHARTRHQRFQLSRTTHGSIGFDPTISDDSAYGSIIDYGGITVVETPGQIDGGSQILDGSLPASVYETTPPSPPTFSISSDSGYDSMGLPYIRLVFNVTHPTTNADPELSPLLDLYGTYIEFTQHSDGAEVPSPVWDRPELVFCGVDSTSIAVEGVIGGRTYWARAYSSDVQSNRSTVTAVQSHTTVGDLEPPGIPQGITAVAGYRGMGVYWNPGIDQDLAFYEVRWAPDLAGAPDTNSWNMLTTKATRMFISDLVPDTLYWVQARAVDLSGNVQLNAGSTAAVNYQANGEAGWTPAVSATPTKIGAADHAFNSVVANFINVGYLTADAIQTGKLKLSTTVTDYTDGLEVYQGAALVGKWDDTGLRIQSSTDANDYLIMDEGSLEVYENGALKVQITKAGIKGDGITFGQLPGGHNVLMNPSFELAQFTTGANAYTYTGSTEWAVGQRTSTDNITEGAGALTMTLTTA